MEESAEEGEGATEFVDIEGGGFDEGQGSENVSKNNEDLKEQVRSLSSCTSFTFVHSVPLELHSTAGSDCGAVILLRL